MIAVIPSAAGEVSTDSLGPTLMHEHILVVSPEMNLDYPEIAWRGDRQARIDEAVAALGDAYARGIRTIVDLTVLGAGRAIPDLVEIAGRVGMTLIVATGLYTLDALPGYAANRRPRDPSTLVNGTAEDILERIFVRDITEGIGSSGVRAAVLKCATDAAGVTPDVETVLRATARAHRRTGAPISTHTDARTQTGLAQLRVFIDEGVDPSRVIIGHSGDSTDLDYLHRLLDTGATLGFDRFGFYRGRMPSLTQRVDILAQLCIEGFAGQIVLSHDTNCHSDHLDPSIMAALPDWRLTHISDSVLPALRERTVHDTDIAQMLVGNPRSIFENCEPY